MTAGPSRVRRPPGLTAAIAAGVALASLPRAVGPIAILVGGLVGASCAVWGARAPSSLARPAGERVDPIERVARVLPLLCLLPVLTMPVAPGADMAMHVALARALRAGAAELSAAWPGVAPAVYPRGFSGLVVLFWSLGPARAGLLASGLAYVLYALGAARLFAALEMALARLGSRAAAVSVGLLLALAVPFHVGWYRAFQRGSAAGCIVASLRRRRRPWRGRRLARRSQGRARGARGRQRRPGVPRRSTARAARRARRSRSRSWRTPP